MKRRTSVALLRWHFEPRLRSLPRRGGYPPFPLVGINGAVLHNRVNYTPFSPKRNRVTRGRAEIRQSDLSADGTKSAIAGIADKKIS